MGDMPRNRHGLIPMLVAIRIANERKRREAETQAKGGAPGAAEPEKKTKKKRGWFG
ncbi:MAG: hypothetical protein ACK4JY_06655 [Brevundimonas sp.]|uniref:hypothetical protein n=1 Tax=Brevundimonas sp. TaxID=1871086 RepID=UPI003919DCDA